MATVSVKVCGYRCGRSYSSSQFQKLELIKLEGIDMRFPACECGSIVFDDIKEEDGPPCGTCGNIMVHAGLEFKCEACDAQFLEGDSVGAGPVVNPGDVKVEYVEGNGDVTIEVKRQAPPPASREDHVADKSDGYDHIAVPHSQQGAGRWLIDT